MSKGISILERLFNLGVASGMPKYMALFGLIQTCILFVPEMAWSFIGLDAYRYLQYVPAFVQYYVNSTNFQNAMFVFWLFAPLTLGINTVLSLVHNNTHGYLAYLRRRADRLKKQSKTSDYSLVVAIPIFLAMYVLATGVYLQEPLLLGDFVPAKSRLAMLIVHAGAVSLIIPLFFSVWVTELRINFLGDK